MFRFFNINKNSVNSFFKFTFAKAVMPIYERHGEINIFLGKSFKNSLKPRVIFVANKYIFSAHYLIISGRNYFRSESGNRINMIKKMVKNV